MAMALLIALPVLGEAAQYQLAPSPYAEASTTVYSCNLASTAAQCREYEILETADETVAQLRDGCQSMQGSFKPARCPAEQQIAVCRDIVRNYRQPDALYDNVYYGGDSSPWDAATVQRVCSDLEGEFVPAQ